MSFFLNPHRFEGTVQEGALSVLAEAAHTLAGAAIAASPAFSAGEASLTFEQDQAGAGAFSGSAEAVSTFAGASVNAAVASSNSESTLTLYPDSGNVVVDAADFDGTNDYLTKLNNNLGLSNSKTGIFSCWFYVDALTPGYGSIFLSTYYSTGVAQFQAQVTTASKVQILVQDTLGSSILHMRTSASVSTGAWNHILAAWDVSSATRQMYLNGSSDTGGASSSSNTNLGWNSIDDSVVGAFYTDGSGKADGGLAELYFAPGQSLDISVQANREKFRDTTDGVPIDLGATGSMPTGTAPAIYMHLDDGETANNFAVNRGTGGNFTVNGALSTFASSPSD